MGFGKDVFCDGIDIYNLADTGEIVSSITTCVGQSTASGPKVAIRRNRPFPPDGDGMRINLKSIHKRNETMPTMEEAIKEINKDAPHQQDQLNYSKDAARSLAASTHGAASHLTKTVCDEDEICVVRRLTTTETARLQGFPDDHTKIDGKDTSDAPQYKAHGNSWATPCAFFMSSRMEMEMRRLGILGTIRYATCCSGIEAHSVAVRTLDWKSLFYSEIEPFPCRVLAYHYPDTPNLGDMTQIHYDAEKGVITNSHKEGEEYSLPSCFKTAEIQEIPFKIGDLHVFSGGTPCFAKGVSVLTKEGYKPIEDIKVGDEVLTHLGRFRKVLRVGSKLSNDLVEVGIVGREKMVCTAEHPFPLLGQHRRKSGEYYFDDSIVTPIKDGQGMFAMVVNANLESFGVKIPELPKVYNATDKEIFELCGWYVGDGYIRGWKGRSKKAIMLCLNNEDIAIFNERFGGKINYTICKSAGIFKVQICCTEFAKFLHTHFGELAHGKKIPMWAYRKEVRDEFIKGYWQTDGCTIRDGHTLQWSTVSQALAYGISDMIGHTCVNRAMMPKTTVIEGRTVNQRDFFSVRHNDAANHFHARGMFDCVKVREVNRLPGKVDTVYNLEVEEDHTYIVNGIVTHNCQSISVAGKREGMAEGSGTRSSLAFHYQRIIDETRPLFTLWENVPGAFSSNGGADFIWFVNKCAESGYTMAWRVLDAQYTMTEEFPRAVPQRRRRIWLVGYRGDDWRIPARIVMELKKSLTEEPTIRIPGKGFKELNPDFNASEAEIRTSTTKRGKKDDGINMFAGCEDKKTDKTVLPRVSEMISFDEMPDEKDFAKVSQAALYEFIKKVGEPCFIGSVFRTDKKNAKKAKAEQVDLFAAFDAPKAEEKPADEKEESDEWEGAEKISPGILANIGNAGILANGRIATISCHEWTSGIQFSPKKYNAWLEVKKNWKYLVENDLLPKDLFPSAYDGTVCGLSDVLEENPDEKYNLSWRACYGILNRAMKRGKELPPALYIALVSTIRDNASLVKWYVLNGRDVRKKETDLTEREIAKACYDTFIAEAIPMDSIEAVEPKKGGEDEEEEDFEVLDDDADGEDVEEFCAKEGLPMADEENEVVEAGGNDGDKKISVPLKAKVPEMPNGVINVSGGETAATLLASGDAAVGTTQDANIIAVNRKVALGVDTKMDASRAEEEVSPTLLATSYKEPPAVVK